MIPGPQDGVGAGAVVVKTSTSEYVTIEVTSFMEVTETVTSTVAVVVAEVVSVSTSVEV